MMRLARQDSESSILIREVSRRSVISKSLAAGAASVLMLFVPGPLGPRRVEAGTCCLYYPQVIHAGTAMYCGVPGYDIIGDTSCCANNNSQLVVHQCYMAYPYESWWYCAACCWAQCAPCDNRYISNYDPC